MIDNCYTRLKQGEFTDRDSFPVDKITQYRMKTLSLLEEFVIFAGFSFRKAEQEAAHTVSMSNLRRLGRTKTGRV